MRQSEQAERAARLEAEQRRRNGDEVRTALRTLSRTGAAFAAAGAAVPFAAALGAGALAVEAVARLLPRRAPDHKPHSGGKRLATIQILNYEGRDLLARNLPSVQEAVRRTGLPHEILVVDNGSRDGSVDLLKRNFPDVSVVSLDRNHFFSAGNNAGIRHARHDIVVLLNNDMR
ncbi:MAG TPA: glycosyltransferase, partial [Myxococcales bacterium]|nr:glycosyltransferase [Myxococcales bacterium]